MRKLLLLSLALLFCTVSAYAEIDLYLAPDGGWAQLNATQTIDLDEEQEIKGTLNNAVVDMIHDTREGGLIKIAMYAFSEEDLQDTIINAAFHRDIKVKILLDGVAAWTKEIRKEFYEKIKIARQNIPVEKWNNLQVRSVTKRMFEDRNRTRILSDGKKIYGTMHEKFGVFYQPGLKVPFDCFNGSANISFGSDQKFSENRFVFKNEPSVARQFAEEFARLWNEYGEEVLGKTESEPYIPADPVTGEVEVIFNGEPINEEKFHRIDKCLIDHIDMVKRDNGTIDIMMFSFTHFEIAQRLLDMAQWNPEITIRIIMDQTQVIADEEHRGVLGPYMEEQCEKRGIKNLHIRYKWRSNIFRWAKPEEENTAKAKEADETGKADAATDEVFKASSPTPAIEAIHWRNLILHHKVMIVNGNRMVAGSYNYSASAEERNFENVMVFNGQYPEQQEPINRMQAEFDLMWNSVYQEEIKTKRIRTPQVVTGPVGQRLTKTIHELFKQDGIKEILDVIDNAKYVSASVRELVEATDMNEAEIKQKIQALLEAGILHVRTYKEEEFYGLAD